jgi:outer membrane protein
MQFSDLLFQISMVKYFKVLSFLLLLHSTAPVSAQPTRTAYIDASKIIARLPEAQDADARLDQLVATWNQEADNIQGDLNRKKAEFERRKLIMTDAERSATEVDIQNVQRRLNEFRQSKYGPNGELASQQASMMKPAYDKLMKAIDEVARDGNYDYVLDKSSKDVAILFSNSKHDLTGAVAKKLGIETDAIMQPLLNSPGTGTSGARPAADPRDNQSPPGSNPRQPGSRTNEREPVRQPNPSGNVPTSPPVIR